MLPSNGGADGDEPEDRPPWHWAAIGAVAIFLAWLPLAAGANALVARLVGDLPPGEPPGAGHARAAVALNAVGFVVAAMAGGALVGRFGGRAGTKEAAAAGFFASATAWALAAAQPGQGPGPGALAWATILVAIGSIGTLAAYAGARFGLRGRARSKPS